jgi:hypothetical protein
MARGETPMNCGSWAMEEQGWPMPSGLLETTPGTLAAGSPEGSLYASGKGGGVAVACTCGPAIEPFNADVTKPDESKATSRTIRPAKTDMRLNFTVALLFLLAEDLYKYQQ